MENELKALLSSVRQPDATAMHEAKLRQSRLAKPPGSLGKLEELSVQLAGITGKVNNRINKKALLVFAADNGVTVEGVSSAPQSVTLMQTVNLTRRKTGAAVLAAHFGCEIIVCDVGINAEVNEPAVLNRKIMYGTNNIAEGPAMTRNECIRAFMTGAGIAADAVKNGADVVGIGEMGIGNTTTSSAVLACLTGRSAEDVTGRGGGITDTAFENKKRVILKALELNKPDKSDVISVIAKVGGLDIAAMAGAFTGAAAMRAPVVIDGFISAVAALCAVRLCPEVRGYLIPSHCSYETGYQTAMEELKLSPVLMLGMRLGEGSGCPLMFEVLSAACAVINDMADFEHAGIDDGYLDEIRKGDKFTVEKKK